MSTPAVLGGPTPSDDILIQVTEFLSNLHVELEAESSKIPSVDPARPTGLPSLHRYAQKSEEDLVIPEEGVTDGTMLLPLMIPYSGTITGKVICVFSALLEETDRLERLANSEFIPVLAGACAGGSPTSPETSIGILLPTLQRLANYCLRVYSVIANITLQLASVYHPRSKLILGPFKDVFMRGVLSRLSTMFRVLHTLDTVIYFNQDFRRAWASYQKMYRYVEGEPSKFLEPGQDPDDVKRMEVLMTQLDSSLMNGAMFSNGLSIDFSYSEEAMANVDLAKGSKKVSLVKENKVLCSFMERYLGETFQDINKDMEGFLERVPRIKIVELYVFHAFHCRLFQDIWRIPTRTYKYLWTFQTRVPMVHMFGEAIWFLSDFVMKHIPKIDTRLSPDPSKVPSVRIEYVKKLDNTFALRVQELSVQVAGWLVRMESELDAQSAGDFASVAKAWTELLLDGMLYANSIRNAVTEAIFLHWHLSIGFRKGNIRSVSVCCELLKGIQASFTRSPVIVNFFMQMITHTLREARGIVSDIQGSIPKNKGKNNIIRDHLVAALAIVEASLVAPPSHLRLNVIYMALEVAKGSGFSTKVESQLSQLLWKLDYLVNYEWKIEQLCCCEFIFWSMDLFEVVLKDIYLNPEQAHRLYYLIEALQDPSGLLTEDGALRTYQRRLRKLIKAEIVTPLCNDIDSDLRLHSHSVMLEQEQLHSVHSRRGEMHRGCFLQMRPLRMWHHFLDIKKLVGHYLDTTFYSFSADSLHDWKIYSEMRTLAKQKFGLSLNNVHLPTHSHYSQSLDVLQIMRNISEFVVQFNYNLNTQMFVQRARGKNHLFTISLGDVANSIRTHGPGIMNTTVNFTYQFLREKFHIFSEFLYDDHIMSRIVSALRSFEADRIKLNSIYPFESAERFNEEIRVLGVNEEDKSYLDHFRELITHIGNALGYVRMIRCGGLNASSSATQFIPNIEQVQSGELSFADLAEFDNPPCETVDAARNLDKLLGSLAKQFDEGNDYFNKLVKPFAEAFSSDTFGHLRTFYVLSKHIIFSS